MPLTPKRLVFIVSFFITVATLLAVLYIATFLEDSLLLYVLFFIGLFWVNYFIFYFILKRFIYEKIKLIFNSIHRNNIDLKMGEDVLENARKEVAIWLNNQEKQLEGLKKNEIFQREFLGNVSHELKTPIFSIQGYILTLLEGGLYDEKINKVFLKKAYKSVERMISIIEDLNNTALLDADFGRLNFEKVNLKSIVLEAIEDLTIQINKQNTNLIIAIPEDVFVNVDKRKMYQVFINLIENAVKYGKFKGKVGIECLDVENKYLIKIKDDGQGIESFHLPRLFERFYRTDIARARSQGGSGLGLSIVKNIIQAHKQVINVSSDLGKGTVLSFTLEKHN